jgi:DMSO/TMAO reductase YedYZ molybdopterin-dependent catalytic subunit
MRIHALLGAAAWFALAGAVLAQNLVLTGPDGRTRTVTVAEIAAMPHQSALLPREGGGPPRRYEGVALTDLLQSVGAPSGKALRGPAMADVVVAQGADGYRAALALAETDAGMRKDAILVADKAEGAPLPANEGPLRLVVEGDLRPARSVRNVAAIHVESAP